MQSYLLAMAVGFGSGTVVSKTPVLKSAHQNATNSTSGPFRDGLYLGKQDAEQGRLRHISVGRWSNSDDRSEYAAGYDAGFLQSDVR